MRRALRIGAWTLGVVLTLVIALVATVLIAGNTAGGRALIERTATRLSDGRLRLSGLSGSFPAAIDLAQLQLSDARGVWLTAERVSLRWSPLALLARHLQVQRLQLARLDIERRPLSQPSRGGGGTHLSAIDVGQLSIERLELGPELTGTRTVLSIDGTAHVVSTNDAAVSLSARRTDGQGRYQLTARLDPSRVDATLGLEEPAGGPLASLLQLPGLGALAIEGKLSGPRSDTRIEVTAGAGEARAGAQGTVDLTRRAADLVFHLDSGAMSPRAELSWQRIALQGHWRGTITAPQADARLRIDRLQIPRGAACAALIADLRADGGDLVLQATLEGLLLPGPERRLLADSALRIAATMRLSDASRPVQLTADHRLISLRASALTAGARSGQFSLQLPDLAPFAALMGQKMRGKTELTGTIRQGSSTTRLDAEAHTDLAAGATMLSSMLAGASRLQLAATVSEQNVEIERLTLLGRALSISVSGNAERGDPNAAQALRSLRARYEVSISNAAVLSSTLGGTVKLNGQIEGPVRSLASRMRLIASLSLRDSPRETIEANIDARGLPSLTAATLQARGRLVGAPLQLDASLERIAADAFHLTVRRAEWKSAHIHADLTTAANMRPGHGILQLRMDRLDDLQPLLGTDLKGSISGSLSLRPVAGSTDTQLLVDARDIVVTGVRANGQISATGPLQALALKMTAQSPDLHGAPGSLEASAHLDFSARKLELEHVEAHYRSQTLRLRAPAQVDFAHGVALSKLELAMQNAVLEVDGRFSPALDLHASAEHIDAALVSVFFPGLLGAGTVNADVRLTGTSSARSGLATITATGLRMASNTARDLPAVDVHATARVSGDSAQLDARLAAGHASQLALTGTAPLDAGGTLSLKLDGKLDLALVNPLLEARGERVTGTLAIDSAVTGAARSPEISGTVDLTNGDLRDYVQGVHLSALKAHLVGSQDVLRLESLTANAGPGQLSMTGQFGMQPTLPLTLRLTAKNAVPLTSNILTANINADLKAAGNLRERLDLSGVIDVNRAVIGIPNAMPPEVAVLDVRRPGQTPPAPPSRKLVIGLDIKLHAPRQILVQGRGLNAEMGGDLHIGATSANPAVTGGFHMIRGTFALASSQLTFQEGRVSFSGTGIKGKIDPTLDFKAETMVGNTTARLHITGLADAPQFELSSDPSLPQDEILARLLFGESASQLTAVQLAEIGVALTTLAGVGGSGPNPLARVQNALGLDRLSVSSGSNTGTQGSQSSGTTVEAGRYVSSRVFVGAKESTTGFSQIEVDVDLSKHLKMETRLGNGTTTTQGTTPENDPGSSVGLLYQFEY